MRLSEQDLERLAANFSVAPLLQDGWPKALDELAHAVGAIATSLEVMNLKTGEVRFETAFELDDHLVREYEERIFRLNPRVIASKTVGVGELMDDNRLPQSPAFSEFWDWLSRTPTGPMQGCKLLHLPGEFAVTGTHFAKTWDNRKAAETERIHRIIFPHMVNAVAIGRTLVGSAVTASALSEEHLEGHRPFALLGRDGIILECSAGFERLLAHGGLLTVHDHRLVARHARDRENLTQMIGTLCAAEAGLCVVPPMRMSSEARPKGIVLRGVALPRRRDAFAVFQPVAILVAHDLDAKLDLRRQDLAAVYGLTMREADVALVIAEGVSVERAAARTGLSTHTVRQHLKAVFRKMEVERQSELVRLLTLIG